MRIECSFYFQKSIYYSIAHAAASAAHKKNVKDVGHCEGAYRRNNRALRGFSDKPKSCRKAHYSPDLFLQPTLNESIFADVHIFCLALYLLVKPFVQPDIPFLRQV